MRQQRIPDSGRFLGVAAVSLTLSLWGCGPRETVETGDRPQVVATSSVLCDLTQQVAADTISLTCLMEPGQDPHTYQARPSDRQAIDEADLVLYDGFNLVPSVAGLVKASSSTVPKVAVFEAAVPDPLMGKGHDHEHGEAHDHGDEVATAEKEPDHAEGHDHHRSDTAELVADPHIWHNASNSAAIVDIIATNLAQVNPERADFYQDNAAQLSTQFAELDSWIRTQVNTIPAKNRRLVTTHDAFRYFAAAYGLEVEGALSGLSTEEKPSAASLTALVDQVKETGVPAIFAETTINPDLIDTVANNAGVKVAEQPLFVEGPGGPGSKAETTQAMLVVNTCTIVNALGGTCVEGDAPI